MRRQRRGRLNSLMSRVAVEIKSGVLLKDYSWWKIGGPADHFCLPTTVEQVHEAVQFANASGLNITILGGGTNVLISDAGVEGLVICMAKLSGVTVDEGAGRLHLTTLAGTPKSELTKIFMKRKLAPALFLCGLPGDVGGGVVMNAGVSEPFEPREFVEIIDWVEVLSLEPEVRLRRWSRHELQWKYRASHGWQPGIVVRAGISWPLTADPDIPRKVKDATKNRLQRQPLELPSCGSTFKNPSDHTSSAGALIERAGLKGYTVGCAQVSPKHANFIVNLGGATARDVWQIITHIQHEVSQQFHVQLETEVRLLGRW